MKIVTIIALMLVVSPILLGQTASNPVASTVRQIEARQSKNLIAAAEEMPADKYSYRPTPDQMTFAHLMVHVSESNNSLCGKIAGEQPKEVKLSETDSKDTLVQAAKDSFAYCEQVLGKADDSKLASDVTLFGGQKGPQAAAFIYLVSGWADHYGAAAMYLRLNGMLPPSAKSAASHK